MYWKKANSYREKGTQPNWQRWKEYCGEVQNYVIKVDKKTLNERYDRRKKTWTTILKLKINCHENCIF